MDQKDEIIRRDCFSMESRLIREHGYYVHPRTHQLIIGLEHDEQPRTNFSNKFKALVTPAVKYHAQQNRSCGATLRKIVYCDVDAQVTQIINGSEHREKPTHQWKSIWYSKGMRRK